MPLLKDGDNSYLKNAFKIYHYYLYINCYGNLVYHSKQSKFFYYANGPLMCTDSISIQFYGYMALLSDDVPIFSTRNILHGS